jgi:hypothetical protein
MDGEGKSLRGVHLLTDDGRLVTFAEVYDMDDHERETKSFNLNHSLSKRLTG